MSFEKAYRLSRNALSCMALALALAGVGSAGAAAAPVMEIRALANTSAAPGEAGFTYFLHIRNVGDAPTSGPLTLRATLPTGLVATAAQPFGSTFPWECEPGQFPTAIVTCTNAGVFNALGSTNELDSPIRISTEVDPGASGVLTPRFEIWGEGLTQADGEACGTAPPEPACTSTVRPTQVTTAAPVFGIGAFDSLVSDALGAPFTQAGGHPDSISTWIDFNTRTNPRPSTGATFPVEPVKDVVVELPPGFVGAPAALAKCNVVDLQHTESFAGLPLCSAASQVGNAIVETDNGVELFDAAVYNMVPPPGVPAAFAFNIAGTMVSMDAQLRSDSDYGLTVHVDNAPEVAIAGTQITFWGVPADPSHDHLRMCPDQEPVQSGGKTCAAGVAHPVAFLRNPTSCGVAGEGLVTRASADSWTHPGEFVHASSVSHALPGYPSLPDEWGAALGTTRCTGIPFDPQVSVQPTTHAASSPTGLNVDVSLPQNSDASVPGTADLKDAVVTLPEGLRVNPSSADGLGACSSAQIGLLGTGFPAPNPIHFSTADPACPDSSKIGTVSVDTPLLSEPLSGSVYLAAQGDNPFGSLLAIYLVVKGQGVLAKLPGHVEADPRTGRLTTRFDDQPQLPFSRLHMTLFNGPRAPLTTPDACGPAATAAQFRSWAQPDVAVSRGDSFGIDTGPGGGACPSSPPFAPSFTAGTVSPQAGGFSPFTLTLARGDSDQRFGGLTVSAPPGLAGILRGVARCTEPQATQGTCGPESLIGHATVGAGAGPDPFHVGGQVFLTGPYRGAPFGLSVVVPVKAGPFDLGTEVVRVAVGVDPHTSQIAAVSDQFPTIVQGIPLDIRSVTVTIDRPRFIFNPTDCEPLSVAGTATSTQGATATVSSRFQAANCANLAFQPSFEVSTGARTSRTDGASLDAKLVFPAGALGSQANIARVKVDLPKQLPSRLGTLQKACSAATFEADPAACPPASRVGTASATTPILAVPLTGPAYFVSHGGAAFPDLTIVLQGEGITIDLVGTTFISKAGITSTTFKQVPDVPVSKFELKLPQGRYSALAAHGNLCKSKLAMPTVFVAQNGAAIHRSTPIGVRGCKPAIAVLRHSVRGSTARIVVGVPSAGRLVAGGKGLGRATVTVAAAGNATIGVGLTRRERLFLARHPGRRLRVSVRLRFTPTHGGGISKTVTLLMG